MANAILTTHPQVITSLYFTSYLLIGLDLRTEDLKLLHTDPKHQRRGAASLLLQSMVDEADKLGLPVLLESSEEGHGLYQKYGFKDVEVLEIDMSKWGPGNMHLSWAMIREPKSLSEVPITNDGHNV